MKELRHTELNTGIPLSGGTLKIKVHPEENQDGESGVGLIGDKEAGQIVWDDLIGILEYPEGSRGKQQNCVPWSRAQKCTPG